MPEPTVEIFRTGVFLRHSVSLAASASLEQQKLTECVAFAIALPKRRVTRSAGDVLNSAAFLYFSRGALCSNQSH